MKKFLSFALLVSSMNVFAADYTCRVTSNSFKTTGPQNKVSADIKVSTDTSMDTKKITLTNGRQAAMTTLFAGGHDSHFQLQLFEKKTKEFIAYISVTAQNDEYDVAGQGQHFDKATKNYEEYSFRCVKL